MAHVSRDFRGRRVDQRDASRLPPGQYLVEDFPVLSAGPTPYTPLEEWTFSITGDVSEPGRGPGSSAARCRELADTRVEHRSARSRRILYKRPGQTAASTCKRRRCCACSCEVTVRGESSATISANPSMNCVLIGPAHKRQDARHVREQRVRRWNTQDTD
jgi:hypothetical protein